MKNKELISKLANAQSLDDVKNVLQGESDDLINQAWQEKQRHDSNNSDKLSLDELDAVSGGADRDWKKDGCAATCEPSSWCGSNDQCFIWDVTYDNFWVCCPDGHAHEFKSHVCKRCGYVEAHYPDERYK